MPAPATARPTRRSITDRVVPRHHAPPGGPALRALFFCHGSGWSGAIMPGMSAPTRKPGTTHFGFREVPTDDKQKLVGEVFSSVAGNYDLIHDLMSPGVR